jgi:hypothetical protein
MPMPTASEPAADRLHNSSPTVREPNLFRFGLRHLFLLLSAAAILCAVMARVGGGWAIVIGSGAALVAAHVFGAFVGTRLRDTAQDVQQWKARPGSADPDDPVALPQPVRATDLPFVPPLPLAGHERIICWSRWPLIAGGIAGGTLGAVALGQLVDTEATWGGIALGSVSCSVMGGWVALIGANFWTISRRALRQAAQDT